MANIVIKNKVTGDAVATVLTEALHLRNFIHERLSNDDVFLVTEDTCTEVPVAKWIARDNYDAGDKPKVIGEIVTNLDDADLLIRRINDFPFNDYLVVRKPLEYKESV